MQYGFVGGGGKVRVRVRLTTGSATVHALYLHALHKKRKVSLRIVLRPLHWTRAMQNVVTLVSVTDEMCTMHATVHVISTLRPTCVCR